MAEQPSVNTSPLLQKENTKPPLRTDLTVKQPQAQVAICTFQQLVRDRENFNWKIHELYTSGMHKECLEVIEKQINGFGDLSDYALYARGLLRRYEGRITDSLQVFQEAASLAPTNISCLKQLARSLFLLGRHNVAISVYDDALRHAGRDWEAFHNKGICYMCTKEYDKAAESFHQALGVHRHDATYLQLGRMYMMQNDLSSAVAVFEEAVEVSPDNYDFLRILGLIGLRMGEPAKAFDYFGRSLSHDPTNPKTLMAACNVFHQNGDYDVALSKYRISAVKTPNSPHLWNNIGMAFFGRDKLIAAIACLKRAIYLAPLEWKIAFNLGLVHMRTNQFASAFHFLEAAAQMSQDEYSPVYLWLGRVLEQLNDQENAQKAYGKAKERERERASERK